jgi:hypothetical protein
MVFSQNKKSLLKYTSTHHRKQSKPIYQSNKQGIPLFTGTYML